MSGVLERPGTANKLVTHRDLQESIQNGYNYLPTNYKDEDAKEVSDRCFLETKGAFACF